MARPGSGRFGLAGATLVAVAVGLAEDLTVPNGQVLILAAGKHSYDTWYRHVATV